MYPVDMLNQRAGLFLLWLPGLTPPIPPQLVLGTYNQDGTFNEIVNQSLTNSTDKTDVWYLDPTTLSPPLPDGVYRYWYMVNTQKVTDPITFTVDYTYVPDRNDEPQPPGVIKYSGGRLQECDVDGSTPPVLPTAPIESLPSNNHMVIYELPTSWAKMSTNSQGITTDVGTFEDVRALFDVNAPGKNFSDVPVVSEEAILSELGINALELLPAADAKYLDAWGYATAHYFAPDYDLGTATELVNLVSTIQGQGARFITDVVMAFGHDSYAVTDYNQFHITPSAEPNNPDSDMSHTTGQSQQRNGFGGSLWRYIQSTTTYDPETGSVISITPSWAFHKSHLARWMSDFGVNGLRLDSVNNIANWDFVKAYKSRAWDLFNARYGSKADPSKFLVIGEELSMPTEMVLSGCLDALWNEPWQTRLRYVLLGQPYNDTFEWTVRKLANCTVDNLSPNFTDGSQAINYITSHDVSGYHKERLFNFCQNNNIWDIERRAKLAFVLLLTSVDVPMIFAGEEFADQEDTDPESDAKQDDPVNYARKNDGGWRQALFSFNANLVQFRIQCPALGSDDTNVFFVDDSRGATIMAWSRGGGASGTVPVVVVANFSDDETPGPQYVVPNWPDADQSGWREVSQQRDVPDEWVGKEPLMPWEAKVYTYWRPT